MGYDLLTTEGIAVEVKSCAYLQSWHQTKPSAVQFGVRKSRAWNADTGRFAAESERQADVFVFALLAHQDKATLDPLDVNQWEFYLLPTRVITARAGASKNLTLKNLQKMGAAPFRFNGLRNALAGLV
jgi:hypothetical protein